MRTFDRGSAVIIEVEIKKRVPYGELAYSDPDSFEITITDSAGTIKVDGATLIKSVTGKYYYICQTAVNWARGVYIAATTVTEGTNNDVTVNEDLFRLK